MPAEYTSKHGLVAKAPAELFMLFTDMRNFVQMLPEDKRETVQADYDTLAVTVQGFHIGIRVLDRTPYSRIEFKDDGAPFHFNVVLHFDAAEDPFRTDFWIEVSADLNFMMKMMLGSKIKEGLDKVVDALENPAGIDLENLKF